MNTEAGPLRCVLDTGSTWNLLNKDLQDQSLDHRQIDLDHIHEKRPILNTENENLLTLNPEDCWDAKTFQINGKEFGPVDFMKMKSPLGLDAIIGMEFIEQHLIFIDFRNEKIYFSKLPEERSPLIRACDGIALSFFVFRSFFVRNDKKIDVFLRKNHVF